MIRNPLTPSRRRTIPHILINPVNSASMSTLLSIMIDGALSPSRPALSRLTLRPSTPSPTSTNMTLIFIISSLLSSPQRRADRTVLQFAAQVALTVWKQWIDATLGYDSQ
ncbi:hypothetical protein EYR40_007882 [Pleurotus pulmonarius]|nr:hypothetical protein EYR38_007811 [Pleurotus pulmonarius]KAF4597430.1 hypothetical protein EYR40_007882 [Pleurotus pulmonarius]